MQNKRFARMMRNISSGSVVAVALLAMGLAACGANSTSVNKNLVLSSDLPVSGTDASNGTPTQNGVQLAVEQNANLGSGYTLTFLPKDDVSTSLGKHDPTQGASNITALLGNPQVMAVVGPFNSNVAASEIPVANQGGLTLISPSNTNPGLTIQAYADPNGFNWAQLHPTGKADFYFRIPGNDTIQGKLLAKIAVTPASAGGPGAKTAFIVDDNEAYGKGLASEFAKNFKTYGGTIVGNQASIDATQTASFPSLAASIVALHPDIIMFGGVTSNGGPQLKAAVASQGGAAIPFIGGDGIADDPSWIQQGGPAAVNTIGTVAAPDLSGLTSSATATAFINAYKAKFNSDPLPYSAMAYDAAMIEITAMKNLIAAGKTVTRDAVRAQIQSISYPGITGTISFDANGDNAGAKIYSVYYVDPKTDQWIFKQNVDAGSI